MSRLAKRLAIGAASAVMVAVALGSPSVAAAAPSLTLSDYGPFVNGDSTTVSWDGFPASEMVIVAVCKKATVLTGPGDCAGAADSAKVVMSSAAGAGSVDLTVIRGDLGSTPAWKCRPGDGHECDIVVSNFTGTSIAKTPIVYAATITSLSPDGRYAGGETVKIKFSGAGKNQTNPPVAAFICDADVPLGDGSLACDFTAFGPATVDASGNGVAKLTIVRGAIGNALGSKCGNKAGNKCDIVITDFNGRLLATTPIKFFKQQSVDGVPKKVVRGEKVSLPRETVQGKKLKWVSKSEATCVIKKVSKNGKTTYKAKGLKVGTCSLVAKANGGAKYASLRSPESLKVVKP